MTLLLRARTVGRARDAGRAAPTGVAYRVGVAAVALIALGCGWYQAWVVPPYLNADEQAHVGYVLTLLDGELPAIDQPIPVERGGPLLAQRVARTRSRHGEVWVANNPPLGYVPFLVPALVARASGSASSPLLGLRLTSVAFFAAAVALTARLGRRLSGGDAGCGLLAAALVAILPHTGTIAGAGYLDTVALFAVVGMLDAMAAVAVSGPTRRSVACAGAWCAVSVGIRPMSGALAGAAAAFVLAVVVFRSRGDRWSGRPGDPRRPGALWSAAVLSAPALVVNGWFYLRNRHRYGDLTGSSYLNAKFGLPDGRSATGVLHEHVWAEPVRTLLNRRAPQIVPGPPLWLWHATRGAVVIGLVSAGAIVVADQLMGHRSNAAPRTSALAWVGVSAVAALSLALAAAHWVSGGMIHPRYLFPALVVVAVAVMLPLARLRLWWAGLLVVVAVGVLQVHESPPMSYYRSRAGGLGSSLATPPGPWLVRSLGPVAVVVGLLGLSWALVRLRPSGHAAERRGGGRLAAAD